MHEPMSLPWALSTVPDVISGLPINLVCFLQAAKNLRRNMNTVLHSAFIARLSLPSISLQECSTQNQELTIQDSPSTALLARFHSRWTG